MKKHLKKLPPYFYLFIFSMPLSCGIYQAISYNILSLKKIEIKIQPIENTVLLEESHTLLNKNLLYSECLSSTIDWGVNCHEKIKNKKTFNTEKTISNKTKKGDNFLIKIIYLLLILALNIQIALFIYTFTAKKGVSIYFFHLSDWAINSPPILGVLGTIISFAMLMNSDDIQKVFSDNFFSAAITTIIGGMFYTINLFLKIRIFPCINKNKEL